MKKIKSLLLSIILLAITIMLSSCDMINGALSSSHNHEFRSDWSFDENNHYYESSCEHNLIQDRAPHTYDDGTIIEGVKTYTCTVCGYEKMELTNTYYSITFKNHDGKVLSITSVKEGEMPSYTSQTPTKEADEEYRYVFIGWSPELSIATTDATYTAVFEKREIASSDDLIHFYPYQNEFKTGIENGSITINDHDELLAYVDYVLFYDVKTSVDLKMSYTYSGSVGDEINLAYTELTSKDHYRTDSRITYGSRGEIGLIYITNSNLEDQATLVMDPEKKEAYAQTAYALEKAYPSTRTDGCTFKVDAIEKTVDVTTSEQLIWVLENGYKPNCIKDSKAEIVYNKAKAVLKEICDDDMGDIEKLSMIYEWLIMNNTYDNLGVKASSTMTITEVKKYDSWYAEGIFNSHNAVCEGFSKALLIMARIEGIETIIVTGCNHAWNKVKIDGLWYGIDATHGNVLYTESKIEVIDYAQFLFTDSYKESLGCTSTDFQGIVANTEVSYFEMEGMYDGIELNVGNDESKIRNILEYIKSKKEKLGSDTFTFEIIIDEELFNQLIPISKEYGLEFSSYNKKTDSKGNTVYTLFMNFSK